MLFIALFGTSTKAQEIESIYTDRPDQSESPMIMYKGFLQFESGLKYNNFPGNAEDETDYSAALPELMIRYGLFKNIEVRLNLEYTYEHIRKSGNGYTVGNLPEANNSFNGFQPPEISIKYRFFGGKKIIPMTAVLLSADVPGIGAERYRLKHFNPGLALLFQNDISERFDLGYNLGMSWDTEAKTKTEFYTLSLGYNPAEQASVFVESYTYYRNGATPDYNLDFGLSYMIQKNMQADFYFGTQLKSKPNVFFGGGFSVRIPK